MSRGFRISCAIFVMVVMTTLFFSNEVFAQSEFEYGQMISSMMIHKKKDVGVIAITLSLGSEEKVEKSLVLSKDTVDDLEKSFRDLVKDITGVGNASLGNDMAIYNYLGKQGWEIIHIEQSSPNDVRMVDALFNLLGNLTGEKMPFSFKDFNMFVRTTHLKREITD